MPSIIGAKHLIPHLAHKKEKRRKKVLTKEEVKVMEPYLRRNATLKELGYRNYREYLASDDWKELRRQVLEKQPLCLLCDSKATEVHHVKYHDTVLLGIIKSCLASLCSRHHSALEVTEGGKKRRMGHANLDLFTMARQTERGRAWLEEFYRERKGPDAPPRLSKSARLRKKQKSADERARTAICQRIRQAIGPLPDDEFLNELEGFLTRHVAWRKRGEQSHEWHAWRRVCEERGLLKEFCRIEAEAVRVLSKSK